VGVRVADCVDPISAVRAGGGVHSRMAGNRGADRQPRRARAAAPPRERSGAMLAASAPVSGRVFRGLAGWPSVRAMSGPQAADDPARPRGHTSICVLRSSNRWRAGVPRSGSSMWAGAHPCDTSACFSHRRDKGARVASCLHPNPRHVMPFFDCQPPAPRSAAVAARRGMDCAWTGSRLSQPSASDGGAPARRRIRRKQSGHGRPGEAQADPRCAHTSRVFRDLRGRLTSQRMAFTCAGLDEGKMPTRAPFVAAVAETALVVAGCAPAHMLDPLRGDPGAPAIARRSSADRVCPGSWPGHRPPAARTLRGTPRQLRRDS